MADIPPPTRGDLEKIAKEGTKNMLVWQGGALRLFSCFMFSRGGGGGRGAAGSVWTIFGGGCTPFVFHAQIEANQVNIS